MNDEGSFALGFFLGWIISGPLIWLIALIAGKRKTRKRAFWCMFIQVIAVVIVVIAITSQSN